MTGGAPLLRARRLFVHYGPQATPTLAEVDLTLHAGERWAVVGESGAGKTTLLLTLLGLLPRRARVEAEVLEVGGTSLLGLSGRAWQGIRGRWLAMVFQDPWASLDPLWRVGDLLVETLRAHGTRRAEASAAARRWLEAVGLDPGAVFPLYPHQLSGGMAQRVALALALCGKPRILLADEPTAALDGISQAQVLEVLRRAGGAWGMALLLVSHDLGVVARVAQWVAVLAGGRVVETGPVGEVLRQPWHPQSRRLVAAAARLAGGGPPPWEATPECPLADRCRAARAAGGFPWVPLGAAGDRRGVRCWHADGVGQPGAGMGG